MGSSHQKQPKSLNWSTISNFHDFYMIGFSSMSSIETTDGVSTLNLLLIG